MKDETLNLERSQTLRRGLHPSRAIAGYTVSRIETQSEPPHLGMENAVRRIQASAEPRSGK